MRIFKNKKGNALLESFTIFIILIILALIALLVNQVVKEIDAEFQADPDFQDIAKQKSKFTTDSYSKVWDGVFIFLLVGLWIAALALSYLIDTYPVFFVITLIMIIILLYVMAEISNATIEIFSDVSLRDSSNDFPMSNFIIAHLVETILVIAMTISIALYAKTR
jgi:hypothetical protein